MQNFDTDPPGFFIESWSLSVEEWFYLLLPFFVIISMKAFRFSLKKALLCSGVLFLAASFYLRWLRFDPGHDYTFTEWDLVFRRRVVTRMDTLMFGVFGAWGAYYYSPYLVRYSKMLFGTGIVLILLNHAIAMSGIAGFGIYTCVFSFGVTALGTALLMPWLKSIRSGKGLFAIVIGYLSVLAYSAYLLNLAVVKNWLLGSILNSFSLPQVMMILLKYFLFWFFTAVFSILLYRYIEKPCMDARKRFNDR